MTDKQQIEELTKDLSRLQNCGMVLIESQMDWRGSTHKEIKNKVVAEALYIANYRKVPENAVVLTQEEYYEMLADVQTVKEKLVRMFDRTKAKTRKETANEFYNKVNENICSFKLENKSQEFIDGYAQAIADICGRLDQVAKQFGVEVYE